MESSQPADGPATRLRIVIRGAVQGVGFRPFIYRLALELRLAGWVSNSAQGVVIEVEGQRARVESFLLRLQSEKPPLSSIQSLEPVWLDPAGLAGFEIRESVASGPRTALILPDIATCLDCLRDIFDPVNRRYGYPFTNCTNCGPRFSIIESLPYDRENTSMKPFIMCPECRAEYDDPANRRFHAQPNACPICGPHLEFWHPDGKPVEPATEIAKIGAAPRGAVNASASGAALVAAAQAIRAGKIVSAKGLGGFHLLAAAHDEEAVVRLRRRKHRDEKPLALMFPSLELLRQTCLLSALEERLLSSSEAPIVLLRRHPSPGLPVAPSVAPGNPNLGVMLPYTPMHHLLLNLLQFPIVATSGNLSDEPICTDEHEAVERLRGIADAFLVHNRPILRHVDDSVARIMGGREMILRRARGYAPLPVGAVPGAGQGARVLGVGAHLKNAVALCRDGRVFTSQHIGDLETEQAMGAFRRVISDLERLHEISPTVVAADAHPDYLSTQFAREIASGQASGNPQLVSVQHHLAHVYSCIAENELSAPVLGVAWDGTGYGLDGTVWGGEFFTVALEGWRRFAHFRQFPLPGGEQAVKEPRRSALGLLYAAFGTAGLESAQHLLPSAFSDAEFSTLKTMLQRHVNSPLTSSVGRLFDAVSALSGLRRVLRFEGQAAMDLEFSLPDTPLDEAYLITVNSSETGSEPLVLDWQPLLEQLLSEVELHVAPQRISAKFHNALAEAIVNVARHASIRAVALSGGCFQNRYLTERAIQRLQESGFQPYWHQRVPPNDGGIALGQVAAVLMSAREAH